MVVDIMGLYVILLDAGDEISIAFTLSLWQ